MSATYFTAALVVHQCRARVERKWIRNCNTEIVLALSCRLIGLGLYFINDLCGAAEMRRNTQHVVGGWLERFIGYTYMWSVLGILQICKIE